MVINQQKSGSTTAVKGSPGNLHSQPVEVSHPLWQVSGPEATRGHTVLDVQTPTWRYCRNPCTSRPGNGFCWGYLSCTAEVGTTAAMILASANSAGTGKTGCDHPLTAWPTCRHSHIFAQRFDLHAVERFHCSWVSELMNGRSINPRRFVMASSPAIVKLMVVYTHQMS